MCLVKNTGRDANRNTSGGGAPLPQPSATVLPLLNGTDKSPDEETPLTFVIEMQQSPACVQIKDFHTGDLIAELDENASRELLKGDDALKTRVYGEVHMLSHQIGTGQRTDLKRLSKLEAEYGQLQRDFDALHQRHRHQLEDRERRILELEGQLREAVRERHELLSLEARLKEQLAELRARENPHYLKQLTSKLAECERALAEAWRRNTDLEKTVSSAEQIASTLKTENDELVAECAAMERLMAQSLGACDTCDQATYDENPDLGGIRILCVGGRNRLIEQYRELVARCNGRFEHYDGGFEDNRQRLDVLLASADAIVCATDTVSHDAYHRLKRFCKRYDKPHVFMRSSGISSFTRALYSMTRH